MTPYSVHDTLSSQLAIQNACTHIVRYINIRPLCWFIAHFFPHITFFCVSGQFSCINSIFNEWASDFENRATELSVYKVEISIVFFPHVCVCIVLPFIFIFNLSPFFSYSTVWSVNCLFPTFFPLVTFFSFFSRPFSTWKSEKKNEGIFFWFSIESK